MNGTENNRYVSVGEGEAFKYLPEPLSVVEAISDSPLSKLDRRLDLLCVELDEDDVRHTKGDP